MAKNILSKYKDSPYANLIFKKVFNPDDAFTKVNLMNLLNDVLAAQLELPIVGVFSFMLANDCPTRAFRKVLRLQFRTGHLSGLQLAEPLPRPPLPQDSSFSFNLFTPSLKGTSRGCRSPR